MGGPDRGPKMLGEDMTVLFSLAVLDTLAFTGSWNTVWTMGDSSQQMSFQCLVFPEAVLALSDSQGVETLPPEPVPLGLVYSAYREGNLFVCRNTQSENAVLVAKSPGASLIFALEFYPGERALGRARAYLFDRRKTPEPSLWYLTGGEMSAEETGKTWRGHLRVEMEKAQSKAEHEPGLLPLVIEGSFTAPER